MFQISNFFQKNLSKRDLYLKKAITEKFYMKLIFTGENMENVAEVIFADEQYYLFIFANLDKIRKKSSVQISSANNFFP